MPSIDVALAVFLASVALPGEGKIDPVSAAEFAEKHSCVDEMVVLPVSLDQLSGGPAEPGFLSRPISRAIHQIWFGSAEYFDQERAGSWQQLAARYGFAYHLWTEDDDRTYEQLFGPDVAEYIQYLRAKGRYRAASDVLRYHLIEHFGGMYFDIDVPAPTHNGSYVDPAKAWPLEGLVLAAENATREVGNSAIFLQNHIIMAAPHHPVMVALAASMLPNRLHQAKDVETWRNGPMCITGQFLLSATISGSFTLLPFPYLLSLGMNCWPDVPSYSRELREKYAKSQAGPARIGSIHRS